MLIPVNDNFVFQLFQTISLISLGIIILRIAPKVACTNGFFRVCTTEFLCPVVQIQNEVVNSEHFTGKDLYNGGYAMNWPEVEIGWVTIRDCAVCFM